MTLLERLSPVERAVFLLHDIFDFGDRANNRKSEAAVRQMIRPRFQANEAEPFTIENGKITAVYRVMNPEKLKIFTDLAENNFEDALSQTDTDGRLG